MKTLRFHFIPVIMVKIKNINDSASHDAGRILIYSWWEYKLVQPLWKSLWDFFWKRGIDLHKNPAIHSLAYTKRTIHPTRENLLIHVRFCFTHNSQKLEAAHIFIKL